MAFNDAGKGVAEMKEHNHINNRDPAGPGRYCRKMLAGEVHLPKLCLLNYDCSRCAFDQWLESVDTMTAKFRAGKEGAHYHLAA